ncbi:hypothetical protein NIBR502772_07640 [Pseudarthrobacter sp. NIBRBAC000502772]|uniref:hypothetical protein n=1 Tax=Pseudarthrobacter sp. NIBRBAC000502772 TaxID=2590775 RepID=UPI00112FD38E|nr:hypothetical protein [Pseudarthrobacter sp. NIBRBAC000502772]QDG66099.1 hypothetical protein NIBR502772_07640 [Pseudarthrobacter sp. NIBRBAC000502772]
MIDPSWGTAGTKSVPLPEETGQWFPAQDVGTHPGARRRRAPPVAEAPAPVAGSLPKYDALHAELIAALEAKMPDISWTVDRPATLATLQNGRCMHYLQTMQSSADVVEPSNREVPAAGGQQHVRAPREIPRPLPGRA